MRERRGHDIDSPRLLGFMVSILLSRLGPFYKHGLTSFSGWISSYIYYVVWGEIIYPCPNFNGYTVEVPLTIGEWKNNFTPHVTGHVNFAA